MPKTLMQTKLNFMRALGKALSFFVPEKTASYSLERDNSLLSVGEQVVKKNGKNRKS